MAVPHDRCRRRLKAEGEAHSADGPEVGGVRAAPTCWGQAGTGAGDDPGAWRDGPASACLMGECPVDRCLWAAGERLRVARSNLRVAVA